MRIQQRTFTIAAGWKTVYDNIGDPDTCDLALVFGHQSLLGDYEMVSQVEKRYPKAQILLSTTSGEIVGTSINEQGLSVTAINFQKTKVITASVDLLKQKNNVEADKALAGQLNEPGLKHVLILSECSALNAAELINGMYEKLRSETLITGGLAGNYYDHEISLGIKRNSQSKVYAIGFYGEIKINHASSCGWVPFGPERMITRSKGNVLYEIDHQPALSIYKKYLGHNAGDLPAAASLFPLSIKVSRWMNKSARTVIGFNEADQSLTFAGEMPEGAYVRLMTASLDKLVEGASAAAKNSSLNNSNPELALLFSCFGRKVVLHQRVEEELEAIRDVFGSNTALAGFYSFGEISPPVCFSRSELNNQTMSITTFTEL